MPAIETCVINVDLLLAWGATFHRLQKGQVLFCEGDTAHFYFQVTEGKIKMCNSNEDGKEFIQGLFAPGQSFGEPPLFDNEPYPASAVAETEATVIRLRKEAFLSLLKDHFEIHICFTQTLARRLRFKSLMAREISSYGPTHRVFTLLKEYKKSQTTEEKLPFLIDLTRQQIADMTGLRVETVIRTIRNLQDEGFLRIQKGKVIL
jgi:CRP/FNR family transcriptional regulator, cyclic AMP receptor protein